MKDTEKRKYARIESTNLLNFVCLDEKGEPSQQGMGRTLNVSEAGILLETYHPIEPQTHISLTIGMEEDLVELDGTVVFLRERIDDTFEAGIQFSKINDHEQRILSKFIKAFEEK